MGLLEKIFGNKKHSKAVSEYFKTLTAYQPAFTSWQGGIYESELCRSAIDAIARNSAKLKIEINGSAKHALTTKLKKAPNEWQTWYQFLYRLRTILECDNTAFIVPVFDKYGNTQGIYTVLPSRCTIVSYNNVPFLKYEFSTGDSAAVELELCGLIVKHQYKEDFFGSNNSVMNGTMDLINLQHQGIKEGIKNGASYRFMAQMGNFADDEDIVKERKRFNRENFEKDGGGLLLFSTKYKDIRQLEPRTYVVDAEQVKIINNNVYNYFGVNEKILQNQAFGDDWNAFYEGCIVPFAIQLSEVLTKMLYTATEQAHGAGIIATSNRMQYMSNKDKLELSAQLLDRGIFTINQVLNMWNLPPVEDGDRRIIRGEYYDAMSKLNNLVGKTSGMLPAEIPADNEDDENEQTD